MQIHERENENEENENEQDKPYFDDAIDKYFDRPRNDTFENMTYPDYFKNYNIKNNSSKINSESHTTQDLKNRLVTKRKKPHLLRFTNYRIDDGEPFFFQHLIMKIPTRSQNELLRNCSNFRERFQYEYPERYQQT